MSVYPPTAEDLQAIPADHGREIETFFATTMPALGKAGYLGLFVPAEFGGAALDVERYVQVIEHLGTHDAMAAYSVNEHNTIGSLPLIQHGTREQHERWLAPVASGERLAAFCLSEPRSGSDVTRLETTAVDVDGGHRITGKKIHISLARHAGLYTVLAEVPGGDGRRLKTAFLVDRQREGVGLGPENSSPRGYLIPVAGSVVLDNCYVPDSEVLGSVGGGGRIFRRALEIARVGLASAYVGASVDALRRTLEYVSGRQSMGKAVSEHQMVQAKLADMSVGIEAARQLVAHAARMLDADDPSATAASAKAKVFATETAREVGASAVQLFGGAAFLVDPPVDWYMRDAKMGEILGGTSEIMRILIAKDLLAGVHDRPRT